MRTRVDASGLLNANLGAEEADYSGSSVRHWALGVQYALVRRSVRSARDQAQTSDGVRRLLVTFGGSDPQAATAAIARRLTLTRWFDEGGTLVVVLGGSYRGPEPWSEWPPATRARVEVHREPPNFPLLCAGADLVISAGGTTLYELCYLGRPFIPVAQAENNARIVSAFARRGLGSELAIWRPGWIEGLAEEVEGWTTDGARRLAASRAVGTLVDGAGAQRVSAFLGQVGGDRR